MSLGNKFKPHAVGNVIDSEKMLRIMDKRLRSKGIEQPVRQQKGFRQRRAS